MKIKPAPQNQKNFKKPAKINKKRLFFIFTCAFIGFFFLCTLVASFISPKLNVPALEEENNLSSVSSDDFKGRIDPRLKLIEMENAINRTNERKNPFNEDELQQNDVEVTNMKNEQDYAQEKNSGTLSQDEQLPYDSRESDESMTPEDTTSYQDQEYEQKPIALPQQPKKAPPKPAPKKDNSEPLVLRDKLKVQKETPSVTKVLVGRYTDLNEAKRVSQELTYSDLNVTPFIKESNGVYSLQVGTFLNPQKAENLANDLRKRNLATRLVQN